MPKGVLKGKIKLTDEQIKAKQKIRNKNYYSRAENKRRRKDVIVHLKQEHGEKNFILLPNPK